MSRKKQRRDLRTPSNVFLDVYDSKGQAVIGEGRFLNVSLTGSLFESRQPLHLRQRIRLQVQSPTPSPFEFAGRVVWRKKKAAVFNYGIQFEPISTAHVFSRPSVSAYVPSHS